MDKSNTERDRESPITPLTKLAFVWQTIIKVWIYKGPRGALSRWRSLLLPQPLSRQSILLFNEEIKAECPLVLFGQCRKNCLHFYYVSGALGKSGQALPRTVKRLYPVCHPSVGYTPGCSSYFSRTRMANGLGAEAGAGAVDAARTSA